MFKEKASWQAAVSYCRSIGTDWVLPSVDNQYDITVIDEGMKKINWNSVWTGIKREIFDDYYWEDGTLDGTLDGKRYLVFYNFNVLSVNKNNSKSIFGLTFITNYINSER